MSIKLDRDNLLNYFNKLKPEFKTGVDKINLTNFERNIDDNFEIICRKVQNGTYKFSRLKEIYIKGRTVYIPTIRDRIVIEYLKDKIKNKYKVHIPDRNKIINNVINLLSEEMEYFIIKFDIKKFFSSITKEEILKKIEKSSLLNSVEQHLLVDLLKKSPSGLPEGLSISNYLSEVYLEGFDMKLKKLHHRISLYYRYVDDVIIVINGRLSNIEKESIKSLIEDTLSSFNLTKNDSKTKYIDFTLNKKSEEFDYLGYKFQRDYREKNNKLIVGICNSKLTKIFNKINYMFYEYYNDNNFEKLYERLLILTSINKIRKTKIYKKSDLSIGYIPYYVIYGLPENYKCVNDDSFIKINRFIKRKVFKLHYIIRGDNRRKLYSVSYCNESRVIIYYSIPFSILRSKVYELSKPIPYISILRMTKEELLFTYFNIVNVN